MTSIWRAPMARLKSKDLSKRRQRWRQLRWTFVPAVAVAAACVPVASASADVAVGASASRIIECGNWGDHGNGYMRWGMSDIYGAGIYNLTTRRVACFAARRFARRYRGTDSFYPRWRCREVNRYESSDVRCTASRGRVIHFQSGG
jgi:hypothetical protein